MNTLDELYYVYLSKLHGIIQTKNHRMNMDSILRVIMF